MVHITTIIVVDEKNELSIKIIDLEGIKSMKI